MADISMCGGEGCAKRETCYRFKATPSQVWQSWIGPPLKDDGSCDSFIPLNDVPEKRRPPMTSTT